MTFALARERCFALGEKNQSSDSRGIAVDGNVVFTFFRRQDPEEDRPSYPVQHPSRDEFARRHQRPRFENEAETAAEARNTAGNRRGSTSPEMSPQNSFLVAPRLSV